MQGSSNSSSASVFLRKKCYKISLLGSDLIDFYDMFTFKEMTSIQLLQIAFTTI